MPVIRVAGYCRVSTDKDDQANSFEAQKRYFREYIGRHPGWELHEIYADEGITGTSTEKRIRFNQMIRDAYGGCFRLVLTKEVSRFSRNILDAIAYTRELKAIGVAVHFLNDGIRTTDPDAELRLSIMASIAQEESRKTSDRVTWGQLRQMERGVVFGRSMLGYNVRNGCITLEPKGAEIVRTIFHKYALEQMSAGQIARFLTDAGIRTFRGSGQWSANTIVRILRNEKYAGDLVQRKTYTPDYLTHKKEPNRGVVPLIHIPNHHEPIVSREVWDQAQDRLSRCSKHNRDTSAHSNRYPFSGKIRCGECGSGFVGRFQYRPDGTKLRRWSCAKAARGGTAACSVGKLLRDDDAALMLKTALNSLCVDRDGILSNTASLAADAIYAGFQAQTPDPDRLRREIGLVLHKKEAVMDSYFSREIPKADMMMMNARYDAQLEALREQLSALDEAAKGAPDVPTLAAEIKAQAAAILSMEIQSDVFCKQMVERLTVFKDRRMELKLAFLPQIFHFSQGAAPTCDCEQNDSVLQYP